MDNEFYPVFVVITLLYSIWNSCVGEMCCCVKADRHNLHGQFTVSVKTYDVTVGHIPLKIYRMCTLFIR